MSDDPQADEALAAIMLQGAAAHEQFVNDMKAMDKAWAEGRMDEYMKTALQRAKDGNQ